MTTARRTPTAAAPSDAARVTPSKGVSGCALDEELLDDLVSLAAQACHVPYAVIHLFGRRPAWSAARMGSGMPACAAEWPGVQETLASAALTIVRNTLSDPRFASHPLVSTTGIRSFVTVPLVTSRGDVIGVVGVFDTVARSSVQPLVEAVGAIARTVVSHVEIRRRADAATTEVAVAAQADIERQRQRVLADILGHTDTPIYAKDLDGRFVYVNRALTESVESPVEMLGYTDHDLFTKDQADQFRRNDELIVRTGSGQVFDEVFTLLDGSLHTYRSTKFPVRDETGRIYAVAGVSVDVTELAAAGQAHRAAEQRWHSMVEHSPVAVTVLVRGGVCRYANRQAAQLLGAPDATVLVGRTLTDSGRDDVHRHSLTENVEAVLDKGLRIRAQRAVLHALDGREVMVEYNCAAILDRGEPAVQIDFHDVSAEVAAGQQLLTSDERFHAVFDNSPVAMSIGDGDGRWVHTNAALERLFMAGPGELIGAASRDFVHPADREIFAAARNRPQLGTGPAGMEVRFIRRDGAVRWVWITLSPLPGLGGDRLMLGIAKDVTDQKLAQEQLLDSQAELAAIAAVAKAVAAGADPRQLVVDSIRTLAGADSAALMEPLDDDTLVVTAASGGMDAVGTRVPLQVPSMTRRAWQTGRPAFLADLAAPPATATVNRALLRRPTSVSMFWQPITVGGDMHAVIGVGWDHRIDGPGDRVIRVIQVIAKEAGTSLQATRVRRELERSATTDPLTGLLNRRAWDGELQRLMDIAQLTGEPLALGLLDLDHFKAYNDRHGHVAGDSRLAEFAAAGRACLRKDDVFARWGGEEFIVALPACAPEQAATILNRIRAGAPAGLTCSAGHTTWIPGEDILTCVARADAALYKAKNAGRNQLVTR